MNKHAFMDGYLVKDAGFLGEMGRGWNALTSPAEFGQDMVQASRRNKVRSLGGELGSDLYEGAQILSKSPKAQKSPSLAFKRPLDTAVNAATDAVGNKLKPWLLGGAGIMGANMLHGAYSRHTQGQTMNKILQTIQQRQGGAGQVQNPVQQQAFRLGQTKPYA